MNRFIKLITIITIGLLASSCDKGKQDEPIKEKNKSIKIQLDAELEAFDVVDNLRTIDLTGKNNSVPQIKVKPTGKVAWAFFGFNNIEYQETDYKLKESNGLQSISTSYSWTANSLTNLLKQGVYGAMFLTGKQGTEAAVRDFTGTTDPNGTVLEEVLEGEVIEREIPLMSNITKATVKTNTSSGATEGVLLQAKLKPRGLLLGFNIKNETDEEIELHNIKIIRTPFHHAGSFSVKDVQENGSNEATVDVAFSGSEGNNFFDLNTKTASLPNGELSKGRYYIWGYPKANPIDAKFVVQIYYSIKGKKGIIVSNKMVVEPGVDWSTFEKREWTNGKAYRFTFVIRGGKELYYPIVNPLAFMAEYNINTDGTDLATNNLVDGGDSGMFTWDKAMELRNSNQFDRFFYMPSEDDWASIFGSVALDFGPGDWTKAGNSKTSIGRNSTVDAKIYSLEEFKKVGNVIYARRYRDKFNYSSAWSYELITKNGSSYIEIKSIGVEPNINVDYIISKAEHFFSHPKVIVRHLPLLGVKDPNLHYSNQWASYWSENFYGGGPQQFFGFETNGSTYGTKPTTTLLPVRLFHNSAG